MWEMIKKLDKEYSKNWERWEETRKETYLKKCAKITQEKTKILLVLDNAI